MSIRAISPDYTAALKTDRTHSFRRKVPQQADTHFGAHLPSETGIGIALTFAHLVASVGKKRGTCKVVSISTKNFPIIGIWRHVSNVATVDTVPGRHASKQTLGKLLRPHVYDRNIRRARTSNPLRLARCFDFATIPSNASSDPSNRRFGHVARNRKKLHASIQSVPNIALCAPSPSPMSKPAPAGRACPSTSVLIPASTPASTAALPSPT